MASVTAGHRQLADLAAVGSRDRVIAVACLDDNPALIAAPRAKKNVRLNLDRLAT